MMRHLRHLRTALQAISGLMLGVAFYVTPTPADLFVGAVGLFGLYLWIESRSER